MQRVNAQQLVAVLTGRCVMTTIQLPFTKLLYIYRRVYITFKLQIGKLDVRVSISETRCFDTCIIIGFRFNLIYELPDSGEYRIHSWYLMQPFKYSSYFNADMRR